MHIKRMDQIKPGMYKSWPQAARHLLPLVLVGLVAWALIIYGIVKLIQVL